MYIKIILAVLRPSVHVHVLPVEFIAPAPSSLYHPLRASNFSKIKAKFCGSLDDSSFRSVSPATHTHKSAIYIAVSRNFIYSLVKDIRREKRERAFPWPRAIFFFFIVRTPWAIGIFTAELFRMSDYVTLRVEHIFRYMIGVIRSHIFSPFNKIFVRVIQSSVLTVESLIGQWSAERAPLPMYLCFLSR